jgi:predicted O-linked N-acetylglucosamine transferase (SPINDLY family)
MAVRYPQASCAPPPRGSAPIRVGIVSGYFRKHSNWKIPIKGWLSQLDRQRFELFGYYTGVEQDLETTAAAALCDRFVRGPRTLPGWRNTILHDAPHVLVYPEVGMDMLSAQLAAQRLARVQCNSWGHPVSSGFPTLDYFLSSDLMEPADGEQHYTERLVKLPNLSIYYEPLNIVPVGIDRAALRLRSTAVVYWCGQALFKYLPQHDAIYPSIAQEVSDCQFAFIVNHKAPRITDLFRERLETAFSAFGLEWHNHCVFLPRLGEHAFIAVFGLCDVFLDSIGWSGCNTTLESLAHNLPIVTLEGQLMRGRHSAAVLRMMGMTETIVKTVSEYVGIASRLGREPSWRAEITHRIGKNKHRIYRDRDCILGLEEFLEKATRE